MFSNNARSQVRKRLTAAVAAIGAVTLLSGIIVMGTATTASAGHKDSSPGQGTGDKGKGKGDNNGGGNDNVGGQDEVSDKVLVCKYVRVPGQDTEVLAPGQNPISVSVSTLPAGYQFGEPFADQHGRSIALAYDMGQPAPACPPGSEGDAVDACPDLLGDQPEGTVCSKDDTTRLLTETDSDCTLGLRTRDVVETTTYEFDYDTNVWVIGEVESVPGAWTKVRGLNAAEREDEGCDRPKKVSPSVSFVDPTCRNLGRSAVRGAVDTAEIDYTVQGTPGLGRTVRVAAQAKDGYEFPSGATTTWKHTYPTLAELRCDEVAGVEKEIDRPGRKDDDVEGVDADRPRSSGPAGRPSPGTAPVVHGSPEVLGVEAVLEGVPTAVDAGLAGPSGAPMPLGQGLVGAGALLLMLAGWLRRRPLVRGAHQV
jgi:hypothetical protein